MFTKFLKLCFKNCYEKKKHFSKMCFLHFGWFAKNCSRLLQKHLSCLYITETVLKQNARKILFYRKQSKCSRKLFQVIFPDHSLHSIFSCYYNSIDLKRQSEVSGLLPDTSSLDQKLFFFSSDENGSTLFHIGFHEFGRSFRQFCTCSITPKKGTDSKK